MLLYFDILMSWWCGVECWDDVKCWGLWCCDVDCWVLWFYDDVKLSVMMLWWFNDECWDDEKCCDDMMMWCWVLCWDDVEQGRSCKQICWPPGVGGLQRVGLDPGKYDHHPHGVVHEGQLQDVKTVVPVIQEAHLGLITVSSSVSNSASCYCLAPRNQV